MSFALNLILAVEEGAEESGSGGLEILLPPFNELVAGMASAATVFVVATGLNATTAVAGAIQNASETTAEDIDIPEPEIVEAEIAPVSSRPPPPETTASSDGDYYAGGRWVDQAEAEAIWERDAILQDLLGRAEGWIERVSLTDEQAGKAWGVVLGVRRRARDRGMATDGDIGEVRNLINQIKGVYDREAQADRDKSDWEHTKTTIAETGFWIGTGIIAGGWTVIRTAGAWGIGKAIPAAGAVAGGTNALWQDGFRRGSDENIGGVDVVIPTVDTRTIKHGACGAFWGAISGVMPDGGIMRTVAWGGATGLAEGAGHAAIDEQPIWDPGRMAKDFVTSGSVSGGIHVIGRVKPGSLLDPNGPRPPIAEGGPFPRVRGAIDEGGPARPATSAIDEGGPVRPASGAGDEGGPIRPASGAGDEGGPVRPASGAGDEGGPARPASGADDEGRPTRPATDVDEDGVTIRSPLGEADEGVPPVHFDEFDNTGLPVGEDGRPIRPASVPDEVPGQLQSTPETDVRVQVDEDLARIRQPEVENAQAQISPEQNVVNLEAQHRAAQSEVWRAQQNLNNAQAVANANPEHTWAQVNLRQAEKNLGAAQSKEFAAALNARDAYEALRGVQGGG